MVKMAGSGISIHALREEGDRHGVPSFLPLGHFYPRPPRGGRLPANEQDPHRHQISIHALREEGDQIAMETIYKIVISIHALREEGDVKRSHLPGAGDNFYPRPPRGGRPIKAAYPDAFVRFLSTPSARRATIEPMLLASPTLFLSTPSARRATGKYKDMIAARIFLSTPSARRATRAPSRWLPPLSISIHALREEGDATRPRRRDLTCTFLSTPSARRATVEDLLHVTPDKFLSTPSARRATRFCFVHKLRGKHFYPRPPRGGRPATARTCA